MVAAELAEVERSSNRSMVRTCPGRWIRVYVHAQREGQASQSS